MRLRIIGDVHGKSQEYLKVADEAPYSVQIGDMGFNYDHMTSHRHFFFKGNHDCYDISCEQDLGDYGEVQINGVKFFFCRGAFSIDWRMRTVYEAATGKKTWWEQEQLNFSQMTLALEEYERVKPDIVLTHTCPRSIVSKITSGFVLKQFGYDPATFTTNTEELFDAMFVAHQPKLWVFGHFHVNKKLKFKGTEFRCLGELSHFDI